MSRVSVDRVRNLVSQSNVNGLYLAIHALQFEDGGDMELTIPDGVAQYCQGIQGILDGVKIILGTFKSSKDPTSRTVTRRRN